MSLEVTRPLIPLLSAVPGAMDVGVGTIITKAGFAFSFVLKTFETRRRNLLFGMSSESRWRSRKEGWKGYHILSELSAFWCLN